MVGTAERYAQKHDFHEQVFGAGLPPPLKLLVHGLRVRDWQVQQVLLLQLDHEGVKISFLVRLDNAPVDERCKHFAQRFGFFQAGQDFIVDRIKAVPFERNRVANDIRDFAKKHVPTDFQIFARSDIRVF